MKVSDIDMHQPLIVALTNSLIFFVRNWDLFNQTSIFLVLPLVKALTAPSQVSRSC